MSLIDQLREKRLAAYSFEPGDIREHYGIEETVWAGGYGYRQIMELVQNGADAILEKREAAPDRPIENAQIAVILDEKYLYVANTGEPLSDDGARALLRSHSSPKRGNRIGRFGIGFKSLLRLEGGIDLISQGLSMRFDPKRARKLIREEFQLPQSEPRRYFLSAFQEGRVRVLCNHSVLTTGFDAPKTDMLLISRQVLSPVRYMQMVGRGLRGEENGGTSTCRIITVMDNLGRFSGRHPYHYCARFFSGVDAAPVGGEGMPAARESAG